jgi:hypothetical protein
MVLEIGELDDASQIARWARRVGDALNVAAVVIVLAARKQHQCAALIPRARSWSIVRTVRSRTSCSHAVTRAYCGTAAATRRT